MYAHQVTVRIEEIEGYHALEMIWGHRVNPRDVQSAFQKISDMLVETAASLYVVVDLRDNPSFPLLETLYGALGPYRHPMLAEWLIVGSNQLAFLIERSLSRVSGRHNVRWFDTRDDALKYLDEATQDSRFE